MSFKNVPGPNKCRGTEDFEINERRGAHSGKYGNAKQEKCSGGLYTGNYIFEYLQPRACVCKQPYRRHRSGPLYLSTRYDKDTRRFVFIPHRANHLTSYLCRNGSCC